MKPLVAIVFSLAIFLTACAPSTAAVQTAVAQTQAVWTPIPSQTPAPTVAVTVEITVIVTATPAGTSTSTPIPADTATPAPTEDKLRAPRGNGIYLVNIDIAPGIWRNNGTDTQCYWTVNTEKGDIISNFYGQGGGTMYIDPTAFQVELKDCGDWTFLK